MVGSEDKSVSAFNVVYLTLKPSQGLHERAAAGNIFGRCSESLLASVMKCFKSG